MVSETNFLKEKQWAHLGPRGNMVFLPLLPVSIPFPSILPREMYYTSKHYTCDKIPFAYSLCLLCMKRGNKWSTTTTHTMHFCLCKNSSLYIVTYTCTSSLARVFMHSLILNTTNLLNQYLNKCCCFNINNKSIEVFWITCNRIVSDFKTRFFHLLKTYSPLLSKAFKAQNTLNYEPPFTGNASVLWASYFLNFKQK